MSKSTSKKKPMVPIITGALIVAIVTCAVFFWNSEQPLCRHIVLAQWATFMDRGYEVEMWHMKNTAPNPEYKYHVAVRVRKNSNEEWQWVKQDNRIPFTLEKAPPKDCILLRLIEPEELLSWARDGNKQM